MIVKMFMANQLGNKGDAKAMIRADPHHIKGLFNSTGETTLWGLPNRI